MVMVLCLDDGCEYYFSARTPYEAMQKMIYTLELKHHDPLAMINKTESGRCLYIEHDGKTYATVNK